MGTKLQHIGFLSSRHRDLPVEVIGYGDLVDRMGKAHFAMAQRMSLGMMMLVRQGQGMHRVDFETVPLKPGRLLFIQPGQVQQWTPSDHMDALVVIARPELCRADGWYPGEASYRDLDATSMMTAEDLVAAVERQQRNFIPDKVSVRLLTDLFSALTGIFEQAASVQRDRQLPEAYRAFRSAIEIDLAKSRDVRAYMSEIDYSERTINRACKEATGLTAKGILDQRLLLEAKRLLAYTDSPVGAIGLALGFGEPSNFNKFFGRLAGQLPSGFRNGLRVAGYMAQPVDS